MRPDLLITHIKHSDYPIWRMNLARDRHRFGKIIIAFSEHNRFPYFDHFIHSSLSNLGNIIFLDQAQIDWGKEDWRNVSTNNMLKYSVNEWVCSIEQDFFADDWNKLYDTIIEKSKDYDLMGYKGYHGQQAYQDYLSGTYVHPAFWFMRREVLEKTNKNFSADTSQGCDHFGLISRDAQRLGIKIGYIQDWGFEEFKNAFHLGGVNQNYLNVDNPAYQFHRPDIFYVYNYFCRQAQVEQDPRFTEVSLEVMKRLMKEHPEYIDPEKSEWAKFFR